MKIKKYIKVGKNKYEVELLNGETILLYEDIILKYDLLLTKEIKDIEKIKKENDKYSLYDKTLGYISKKLRSEKEIKKYLLKYTSDSQYINSIINKLYENNILNKNLYIKSYIHDKINFTNDGPIKIKNDLINLGFDSNLIDDILLEFDLDIIDEKINKYLNKQLKNNKKSLYVFKNKMLYNLINLGYEKDDILRNINKIKFDDKKGYDFEKEKLIKKYSKKYNGYELEMIVNKKLYEKGFKN